MSELLAQTQYMDKYSRYDYNLGRRENWQDTVKRVSDYLFSFDTKNVLSEDERRQITEAIERKEVMPSMRNLAMAGKAAERQNACSYNCSYMPVTDLFFFYEAVIILMSGTGLGYSVERKYINQLPFVEIQKGYAPIEISVEDTTEGWADSILSAIVHWVSGFDVVFDFSQLRPAGSILKTKGGRASGHEVLEISLKKIKNIVLSNQGKQLTPLQVHDMVCHVAKCIVSGGVRRCLPTGTKVHTKYGVKNIERVSVGDFVLTSQGYKKVSNKFKQGKQNLVRIVTKDSSFECTANHKIAVLIDKDEYIWKPASELTSGDLLIAPSFSIQGTNQRLPEFEYEKPARSTTCKDITIPELDEDMAWLLGLIQGDGYVRLTPKSGEVSVAVAKDEYDFGDKVEAQLRRFGVNTIKRADYENYYVVRVKSKQLATYFHSWLKKPKTNLEIPEMIWNSTTDIKLAYISGLMDADGSIKTRPVNVVTTIYKSFAKDVQILLSSCGIQTRVKALSTANLKENWKPKFSVSLINNKTKESFSNIKTLHKRTIKISTEQNGNSYSDRTQWSKTDYKLIPVDFIKLEKVEEQKETWDLEIEDKHEFFANGYLVHNSAAICIFDYDDKEMATCKNKENIVDNEQRYLSNNSAVFTKWLEKDEISRFMNAMFDSYAGEPGIFSRYAVKKTFTERREYTDSVGTNPCGEIILRPFQFCNLSSIVCRSDDTIETLLHKTKIATIIGTIQSMAQHFPNLRQEWVENQEKERLLGVDLNGIMDCPILENTSILNILKEHVIEVNKEYSSKFGINQAVATTCVKPSGNASVMLNTSAGIHDRFSQYYIRRIQLHKSNPVLKTLQLAGIPTEPSNHLKDTFVASFPVKSPTKVTHHTALQQLEIWKRFKKHWTEHNPSCTISYEEDEKEDIIDWLYLNQDIISGLSFLPKSNAIYEQMPYEAITEEKYNELIGNMPDKIDWEILHQLETDDMTNASQTSGCDGNKCLLTF